MLKKVFKKQKINDKITFRQVFQSKYNSRHFMYKIIK